MNDILNKTIVLVLNRNWQAINIRTLADAFCQMATNAATALDIDLGEGGHAQALRPVTWDEWFTLPVREGGTGDPPRDGFCFQIRSRRRRIRERGIYSASTCEVMRR